MCALVFSGNPKSWEAQRANRPFPHNPRNSRFVSLFWVPNDLKWFMVSLSTGFTHERFVDFSFGCLNQFIAYYTNFFKKMELLLPAPFARKNSGQLNYFPVKFTNIVQAWCVFKKGTWNIISNWKGSASLPALYWADDSPAPFPGWPSPEP